ncbi:hypothetical protein D3C72_2270010 [compost metagenome]
MVRATTLCALVAVAMVIYFAIAFGIGGANLGMIRRNLKRKAKAKAEPATPPDADA